MFPSSFHWGAATSSYQIEGAALEDGRGECIWTRLSHTPGKVRDNHNGDVACDHYHRYAEDIALMQSLSLNAYRFSVSWPRVIPKGTGAANEPGLAFYDRLIDGVLEAGMTPYLTLYHWDLPQALQDRGGWANTDMPKWFADYTDLVTRRYGDRVKHWTTLNEPYVVAFVGHYEGRHAPGIRDLVLAYRVAHHTMLSHGQAVPVIRQNVPDAEVSIVLDIWPSHPQTDTPEDHAAAVRFDGYHNRWFLDPVFKGTYPQDIIDWLGDKLRGVDDLSAISQANVPIDALGINYYTRAKMAHEPTGDFQMRRVLPDDSMVYTQMQWEVYPDGLHETLMRLHREYAPKSLYVAENGSAWEEDAPTGDVLEDPRRVDYLHKHLGAVERAIADGVPMSAYFAWSLMDNFEWAHGYHQRFGIVHVDFETLKRTPKRTALEYRDFIRRVRGG
ncbi:MAG: GH1 family beta-glucosidase [Anaerolineae bacterium]|nr:GH1 family beta-glucosidase [Anaerolineae bacterium]